MNEVLSKQVCTAAYAQDMVRLKFGSHSVLMYYQTAFEIAAGVLSASKQAGQYEGVHPSRWSEYVNMVPQTPMEPLSLFYRRGDHPSNFTSWSVAFERNLVVFTFDQTIIKMHFGNAFEMYGLIRLAGKNAKNWAGDTSRQWTTKATLTDAEQNDKYVYVN